LSTSCRRSSSSCAISLRSSAGGRLGTPPADGQTAGHTEVHEMKRDYAQANVGASWWVFNTAHPSLRHTDEA
jgi:hypothetical protein